MNDFMISFGVAFDHRLGDRQVEDQSERRNALVRCAYTMGPAWGGGQPAVFLRSDLDADQVIGRFLPLMFDVDFVLVVQVAPTRAVRYAGQLFDEEGFEQLFPDAVQAVGGL
jgi:hypothetical protein